MTPLNVNLTDLIRQVEEDLPESDPIARVAEARLRSRTLGDLGDQLVDHFVTAARAQGASWSQVGEALGVSKQAAQQRSGSKLFEKFTDRARHVMVLSQERARALHHNYIGTEHLLLGVLGESGGLGAKVLGMLAGSVDTVVEATNAAVTPGTDNPTGHIPFTSLAKRALDESLQAAMDLGHDFVGTEHLMLGLLRVGDGVAARVLTGLGIDEEKARTAVRAALVGYEHRGKR